MLYNQYNVHIDIQELYSSHFPSWRLWSIAVGIVRCITLQSTSVVAFVLQCLDTSTQYALDTSAHFFVLQRN